MNSNSMILLLLGCLTPMTLSFFLPGTTVSPSSSVLKISTLRTPNLFQVLRESKVEESGLERIEKIIEVEEKKRARIAGQLAYAQKKMEKLQETKQAYLNGVTLPTTQESVTETTLRSIVKSFMWRVIAGSVTFITAVKFSGSVATALSIVGSDFFSKSATMFIGERIMNKSQAGRAKGGDDVGRSLAKALIWRAFALVNTLSFSLVFAGDLKVASKIASSDAVIKTAMMFVYERIWAKVAWGKQYDIDFSI